MMRKAKPDEQPTFADGAGEGVASIGTGKKSGSRMPNNDIMPGAYCELHEKPRKRGNEMSSFPFTP
jgi:hypothetical protein